MNLIVKVSRLTKSCIISVKLTGYVTLLIIYLEFIYTGSWFLKFSDLVFEVLTNILVEYLRYTSKKFMDF